MELLLTAAAAGFVVWLIMRRNRPAPASNGKTVSPAPRARSGGPGFIGWLAIIGVGLWGAYHLLEKSAAPPQSSEASKWAAPANNAAAGDPYDQTVCSASKRAIEAKLKSPGSAKWV